MNVDFNKKEKPMQIVQKVNLQTKNACKFISVTTQGKNDQSSSDKHKAIKQLWILVLLIRLPIVFVGLGQERLFLPLII